MDKETELFIEAKVAQAKLQVSEERNKLFLAFIALMFSIFGIGIPIWSKIDFENRFEKVDTEIKTKMAELENKYSQKPEFELSFKTEKLKNEQEIQLKCDSSYYVELNNNGLGRGEFVKIKLYFTEQQYYSYGPMQEYWANEVQSDEPGFPSMFMRKEEYINPGDKISIPIQCPCEVRDQDKFKSYLKITADKMAKYQINTRCMDTRKWVEKPN